MNSTQHSLHNYPEDMREHLQLHQVLTLEFTIIRSIYSIPMSNNPTWDHQLIWVTLSSTTSKSTNLIQTSPTYSKTTFHRGLSPWVHKELMHSHFRMILSHRRSLVIFVKQVPIPPETRLKDSRHLMTFREPCHWVEISHWRSWAVTLMQLSI